MDPSSPRAHAGFTGKVRTNVSAVAKLNTTSMELDAESDPGCQQIGQPHTLYIPLPKWIGSKPMSVVLSTSYKLRMSTSCAASKTDEIAAEFKNMRMRRKHRYLICKLNDAHNSVEIEKIGARDDTFESLKDAMPKDNARYVFYDLEWEDGSRKVSKMCFILYSPDSNTNTEEKMAYASLKSDVTSKLSGCNRDFQVNRWEDLAADNMIKEFS
jgi:cofilin